MPDFDNQTLAALRGRMVRYLMRSREVRNRSETVVTDEQCRYYVCDKETVRGISYLRICILAMMLMILLFLFTQITLGRATKDKPIDVDLSLEGPAWKISRKQGE